MAADVRPEIITPFGPSGPTWYLTDLTTAPTHADVTYNAGDRVILTAPVSGGATEYICVAGGKGGTATFKVINNA